MKNPTPKQIKTLRERVQAAKGLGVTEAQEYCASLLYASPRSWQRWETSEGSSSHRKMQLALWELINLKLKVS